MQGPLIAAAIQILTLSCMALLQLPVLQVASAANFSYLLIYTASSGWFVAVVHLETHTWQGMTRVWFVAHRVVDWFEVLTQLSCSWLGQLLVNPQHWMQSYVCSVAYCLGLL